MTAERRRLTKMGKLIIFLFVAACLYGAYQAFSQNKPVPVSSSAISPPLSSLSEPVTIGIAYGTEKRNWLTSAVEQFAATEDGQHIHVELIPMGSQEGAKAVIQRNKNIHVWAPASSIYKNTFLQDWQIQFGTADPIVREEVLALSPMVIVMWENRYQQFIQHFPLVNFLSLTKALLMTDGWGGIANKPDWGLFKFGHTNPMQSNSGLLTLTLMAYDYHNKCRNLTASDIVNSKFQQWLQDFTRAASGLSNSTGNMMREMVLKGPSVYDALFVYESTAIDYLKAAQGRWGSLHVIYPERNMWNDNPYYILNTPWMTAAHIKAANTFLDFLLSSPIQLQALIHGFRPGDPSIAINNADSPFIKYQSAGLQIDINTTCEPPDAEVITNLLNSWQRSR